MSGARNELWLKLVVKTGRTAVAHQRAAHLRLMSDRMPTNTDAKSTTFAWVNH